MSQTLLFSIGCFVFAITVVASLLYGYFTLDRIYQADEAERGVIDASQPSVPDVARSRAFPDLVAGAAGGIDGPVVDRTPSPSTTLA